MSWVIWRQCFAHSKSAHCCVSLGIHIHARADTSVEPLRLHGLGLLAGAGGDLLHTHACATCAIYVEVTIHMYAQTSPVHHVALDANM